MARNRSKNATSVTVVVCNFYVYTMLNELLDSQFSATNYIKLGLQTLIHFKFCLETALKLAFSPLMILSITGMTNLLDSTYSIGVFRSNLYTYVFQLKRKRSTIYTAFFRV